jgi:hypothetical protein
LLLVSRWARRAAFLRAGLPLLGRSGAPAPLSKTDLIRMHGDSIPRIGYPPKRFEGTWPDPRYDQARSGYIGENTVYNISSYGNPAYGNQYGADGIYIDGGTQIIIERNLVHNADIGIEMASEHQHHVTSYVITRSNLVYYSNVVGISIGGYDSTVGGTDHCTILNNTLYADDTKNTGTGEFQIQYYATNNMFKNNILYATIQGLLVNNFH